MTRHIKIAFEATATARALIFGENNAVSEWELIGIPATGKGVRFLSALCMTRKTTRSNTGGFTSKCPPSSGSLELAFKRLLHNETFS
jgi:hypothetical protein